MMNILSHYLRSFFPFGSSHGAYLRYLSASAQRRSSSQWQFHTRHGHSRLNRYLMPHSLHYLPGDGAQWDSPLTSWSDIYIPHFPCYPTSAPSSPKMSFRFPIVPNSGRSSYLALGIDCIAPFLVASLLGGRLVRFVVFGSFDCFRKFFSLHRWSSIDKPKCARDSKEPSSKCSFPRISRLG